MSTPLELAIALPSNLALVGKIPIPDLNKSAVDLRRSDAMDYRRLWDAVIELQSNQLLILQYIKKVHGL